MIPTSIRSIIKKNAFVKFFQRVFRNYFSSKYYEELRFQRKWVDEFKQNYDRVFEYWKKFRNFEDIVKICEIGYNKKVLDVGCGISTVLHYMKGKKFGVDPLAGEYSKLYKYPDDMNIRKGYGENLPFIKNFFDIVICTNALDHVVYPKKTIDEIYRVLKTQSYFILIVEIFERRRNRDAAHPYSFTKKDIDLLVGKKFEKIYTKVTPWIGLRKYINGSRKSNRKELIVILKKRPN